MIIGGAASGKSAFAEAFVIAQSKTPIYLATAQAFDAEMANKIAAHKTDREAHGWRTIEEPMAVADQISKFGEDDVVLLDCATMWLSNTMADVEEMRLEIDTFCDAIAASPASITVVTNEVGQGIVPENVMARRFRDLQGNLNFSLAKRCDLVVQVVAGLPNVLKGELPEW